MSDYVSDAQNEGLGAKHSLLSRGVHAGVIVHPPTAATLAWVRVRIRVRVRVRVWVWIRVRVRVRVWIRVGLGGAWRLVAGACLESSAWASA